MASYYVYSGAGGSNNGSSWANAFTTLTAAFSGKAAGDIFYVAHDHAESSSTALTLTSNGTQPNPTKVICVNRSGSVPPGSADRRATAQVTTTGASAITIANSTHYDGIIFSAGTTTVTNINLVQVSSNWQRFDNCSLRFGGAVTGSSMLFGAASGSTYVELNNTTLSFAHVGQTVSVSTALCWRNTPAALLGTAPTTLFVPAGGRGNSVECIGVDFSAMGSGKTICDTNTSQGASYRFLDCKLDAAVTKSNVPGGAGAPWIDFVRSGAAGVNYAVHRHRYSGLLTEETTIVRAGGASDGTTPIAWKIVTTTNSTYSMPFECPPIAIWNDVTGLAVTATVEGIWGGGAVPNDDDVWLSLEYLGSSSSPLGSFVNDGKADLLATATGQTSSSETWGGSTTKFKLEVTFTPQMKGWLYGRVMVGKASSTFFIDPVISLS